MKSRSIPQLIATGFTLVSVPLITVVVTAVVQVDRLAERNRHAVLDAEMASQHSRALTEHVTTMERSLVQFYVLGESSFYDIYLFRRDEFHNAAEQLRILRLGPGLQGDLANLVHNEEAIYTRWGREVEKKDDPDPELNTAFTSLGEKANNILSQSRKLIQLEANNAIEAALDLQQLLLLQAAAVIPTAILAAVLFAFLITSSIKKIDHAIRDLGAGEFTTPIQIDGPNDLKELGERLDWLRERISELETQKINFLRHISHELKTPLTAIREASELLTDEQQRTPEDVEIIQIIQESSLQLQELIEGLLQFGKTDNLFKPLSRESLHFPTLIKDVIAEYSLAISTKQVSMTTDLDDVMLYGDYERLRIVLNNLISNAVRYSPNTGHIQVTLAKHDGQAVLEVENTGPGIDRQDCPYVFEPFYRGRATETGPVKGSGLGLTIAKEYVEAHQGNIQVLNGNLGALLRVHLPLISV